jgi:hypothetical protein
VVPFLLAECNTAVTAWNNAELNARFIEWGSKTLGESDSFAFDNQSKSMNSSTSKRQELIF